ncbi:NADH:flavin oxidoreductase [Desulfovibrio sp. OttesenSCG-928-G15]|nr:NADH:flavin oxidoreductase [Desulfovibrio sp. OttesenSCG-928-G15]
MQTLFTPCLIEALFLRNSLVYLPFYTAYADETGMVTEQLVKHYVRMAETGVALVVVEASAIRTERPAPFTIHAFDQSHIAGLSTLATAIHEKGARAFVQICHPGRYSGFAGAMAPSAVPAFGNPDLMPVAMSEQDMRDVAEAFAQSADIVKQAGFDGVELHGGTGYLLASFTSPRTNKRTDAYGGSTENRARFPQEVCKAVREKVGNFPVGYRFMAREYLPDGLGLEEGTAIAGHIAKALSPIYFSVTAGSHECFAPSAQKKQKPVSGFMLDEAAAVKKAVPGVAIIAAGLLDDPAMDEAALVEGKADCIGLGRVLFADPDWLAKAEGKLEGKVRSCVQCNNCVKQIGKGAPAFCSRWSKAEKERYLAHLPKDRVL